MLHVNLVSLYFSVMGGEKFYHKTSENFPFFYKGDNTLGTCSEKTCCHMWLIFD